MSTYQKYGQNADNLSSWQNVYAKSYHKKNELTKCLPDKMSHKIRADKMSSWQNVYQKSMTKCHPDNMSSWQNVCRPVLWDTIMNNDGWLVGAIVSRCMELSERGFAENTLTFSAKSRWERTLNCVLNQRSNCFDLFIYNFTKLLGISTHFCTNEAPLLVLFMPLVVHGMAYIEKHFPPNSGHSNFRSFVIAV